MKLPQQFKAPTTIPYKWINVGLVGLFMAVAGANSFYTVEPTEVANIRRLGTVVHDTPVGSGTHFKLPFIDTVDKAQLSLRTLQIPTFYVNTVDNQRIGLDINFTYTLPVNQVNRMLYDTGSTSDGDIDDNSDSIIPIAMDRAARVFARQNTTGISANREAIQAEVTAAVFADVRELFGLEPQSLQIGAPRFSPTFIRSNEIAADAKNDALAEENKKDSVTAVASQQVIEATGVADAQIAVARGNADAIRMTAEANLQARMLEAQGEEARLRSEIAPFGNPAAYIEYLEKLAAMKWNGQRSPVEVTGGGNGNGQNIVVPVPGLK
jgi:regulator of protease activity HflC (stomatin/prohibitin superfamily)